MSDQKNIFLESEADQWFERNKTNLRERTPEGDVITRTLKGTHYKPKRILEVGCANGFRLQFLKDLYQAECHGIDPSKKAIVDGQKNYPKLNLKVGTAESLDTPDDYFDMIILGFLMYLCDRNHLFKIASEVDRTLKSSGHIVILDFYSPIPYKNPYCHLQGIFSYKMSNSAMFLWNPNYVQVSSQLYTASAEPWTGDLDNTIKLEILQKDKNWGFPNNPYK